MRIQTLFLSCTEPQEHAEKYINDWLAHGSENRNVVLIAPEFSKARFS
jgi:hypothetical protein